MSNDYFKAQGWFKTYALNSQDSRGVFQELVKEDEEAFRLASAETDKIKEEMNKQFGSGTIKYGSEIPQPEMKTPQAIFEFSQRNPAAEGGRMKFDDGLSALNFGKEQNIFTPQSFQKILGAAGQRDYAPAYKVIINSLKKAGIEYTSPKSAGATATFDNVTKETIDIFNKEATKLKAEAGLPMSRYQTSQLKKDIKIFVKDKIAKGEYVSRPVIKEHFGLTEGKGGDMLITRSLGVNEKAGTGLLKNLGQDEQKAAAKANFAKATAATMETKNDVLKIINDEFRLDPDLSNSEDLAKTIYGDQFPKGDMKNMSIEDLRKAEAFVRQTDNDVMSYLRVIKGLRDKPDKMRLPTQNVINDITDNILSGIDDEAGDGQSFKKKSFRFSSGLLRDYKMAIINKNLGLDPDTYRSERAKKILKNKNLDEIFSMSALADIAPGYTTKVQSIKKLINTKKASEIDLPFQRIINALNEGKTSMQLNKKIVPIEDAIKDFNKTSAKFSKKNKVQSPKINYNEKFDETILDSYGKASQKNIKKVYKDKNFFLSDIDPKIKTQDILKQDLLKLAGTKNKKCKGLLSYGGRVGLAEGLSPEFCLNEGKKVAQEVLFEGGGTPAQKSVARRLISAGGKMALSMLNPRELIRLSNLVGPGALGLMGLYEAGSITDDVLRLNKPLDEALAGNWLTKSFLPYSEEFAKQKNLLQSGQLTGDQKEYALEMMKMENFIKEGQRIEGLESNKLVEGTLDDNFTFTSKEDMNKAYKDLFGRFNRIKPYAYEQGITGRGLENEAVMNEYMDAQTARTGASKVFGGPQPMVNKAPRPKNMGRGPMTEKGKMNLDFSIPGYTSYDKAYNPSNEEILQIYRNRGIVPATFGGELQPGEGTRVRMGLASQGDNRSIYGSKFMEGGIASLNVNKK